MELSPRHNLRNASENFTKITGKDEGWNYPQPTTFPLNRISLRVSSCEFQGRLHCETLT